MRRESLLILSALASEPRHGYAIIKKVAELSADQKQLRPGTLYAALGRFEADGLVEIDREEVVDGRNRRYYRITSSGRRRLVDLVGQRSRELEAIRGQLTVGGLS